MACCASSAVAASAPSAPPASAAAPGRARLVLLRHGESTFNALNVFTGWLDVPLSAKGREEAVAAAALLRAAGLHEPSVAFTSALKRAVCTLHIVLEEADSSFVEVRKSWLLNERHYGALQGLNKAETAAKHGEDMVKIWRRSYDIPPPPLAAADARHPANDERYTRLLGVPRSQLPASESLKDCVARVLPFYNASVEPLLRAGRDVLIVAHGNSLRALIKHLDSVSDADIAELNVPTAVPLVYEIDSATLRPVGPGTYLGDAAEAKAKADAVAAQGKAKV